MFSTQSSQDKALLRPGRIDHLIYVSLPDVAARRQILSVHTRQLPLHDDVQISVLANTTERYTGAELASVCREAALNALRNNINATKVNVAKATL